MIERRHLEAIIAKLEGANTLAEARRRWATIMPEDLEEGERELHRLLAKVNHHGPGAQVVVIDRRGDVIRG